MNRSTAQNNFVQTDVFQTRYFIENRGQFSPFPSKNDSVSFKLENGTDIIYFHRNGFTWSAVIPGMDNLDSTADISKIKDNSHTEIISQIWLNSNPNCKIITEGRTSHYFTYGEKMYNSFGFTKLIYQNIYPNIDLVYELAANYRLHYYLRVHKGADITKVKYTYSGYNISIASKRNELKFGNDILQMEEGGLQAKNTEGNTLSCEYTVTNNNIGFELQKTKNEEITIDPWVGKITTLTMNYRFSIPRGENAGFDVDFDYNNNLYVYGGVGYNNTTAPNANNYKVAKYSKNGKLLWTFMGEISSIAWYSNQISGVQANFLVEKNTGTIYIGQTMFPTYVTENRIVGIDTSGNFDGYSSNKTKDFGNTWDMCFTKKKGEIVAFGGDFNGEFNDLAVASQNGNVRLNSFSGSTSIFKGVACATEDNKGTKYIVMASYFNNPSLNNTLMCLTDSLNATKWQNKTGFNSLLFWRNKVVDSIPYIYLSNGYNALAANANYLFFYDGRHIAAYDKNTGTNLAADSNKHFTKLYQGGIAVDACNHVFVGGDSGNIKAYYFDGKKFIYKKNIALITPKRGFIRDIRFDPTTQNLFISGDSLIASIANPFSCYDSSLDVLKTTIHTCENTLFAKLKNPDSGALYTFEWIDSAQNKTVKKTSAENYFTDTLKNAKANKVYLLNIYRNIFSNGMHASFRFVVHASYKKIDSFVFCNGDSFVHNKKSYKSNGLVTDSLHTRFGCDSILIYKLKFRIANITLQNINLCRGDSLQVGRFIHKKSGVYKDTLKGYMGCDSLVISTLKLLYDSVNQNVSVCRGKNCYVGNKSYKKAGRYIDTLKNAMGCDSVVVTNLTLLFDSMNVKATICEGDSFIVGNHKYKTAGLYKDIFKNTKGCDSVIVTQLKVLPDTLLRHTVSICPGDSVAIGIHFYKKSGLYTDSLLRQTGCDSVIITTLTLIPPKDSATALKLCNEEQIVLFGKTYKAPNVVSDTFTSVVGCDSIFTYYLIKSTVKADFTTDSTQQPLYSFNNLSNKGVHFIWNFGDNSAESTDKNPSHTFPGPGKTYTVCLISGDSFTCSDTICKNVTSAKLAYWVYNSFTPGNDGKNDVYKIGHSGGNFLYNLYIYNRWGELVYHTKTTDITDETKLWNGNVENTGSSCPAGSYFGRFQFFTNGTDKPPVNLTVTITLIR